MVCGEGAVPHLHGKPSLGCRKGRVGSRNTCRGLLELPISLNACKIRSDGRQADPISSSGSGHLLPCQRTYTLSVYSISEGV
jgi:hypothetical protein